ncbi:MAG: phosphoribosylformylglycinamidine cyclo-ligase [Chloroflexota bacterium]
MKETTYRDSGVDIESGNRTVSLIKGHVRSTFGPEVLADIGLFGGLFALGKYEEPVLVSSADGVGTKIKLAALLEKYDTIGIDLVNHCVNDILTSGAQPLFFLDYYAAGVLVPENVEQVVKGLAQACRAVGCALIGGETAEMPDLYAPGDFDLAGFIVGVAERSQLLAGRSVVAGDCLLGLPSSGMHTNGFSLVRKVLGLTTDPIAEQRARLAERPAALGGLTWGEALLTPHHCYLDDLRPHLGRVKALAHITGGGLLDNVPRVLPEGLAARFDLNAWEAPAVFALLRDRGNVPFRDLYRTFNMGIGMVVVVGRDASQAILDALPRAALIGEVVPLAGERVELRGGQR